MWKLFLTIACVSIPSAYAFDSISPYAELRFGLGSSLMAKDQRIQLLLSPSPGLQNGYFNQRQEGFSTAGMLGIGLSMPNQFGPLGLRFGLDIGVLDHAKVKGHVFPFINVDNDFDRVDFTFEARSYLLLGRVGVDYTFNDKLTGYLDFIGGRAWNRLSNYTESATEGSTASPTIRPFHSATTEQMAYGGELGVSVKMSKGLSTTFGYQFLTTGKAELGPSSLQDIADHYETTTMKSHLFTFGVRQSF